MRRVGTGEEIQGFTGGRALPNQSGKFNAASAGFYKVFSCPAGCVQPAHPCYGLTLTQTYWHGFLMPIFDFPRKTGQVDLAPDHQAPSSHGAVDRPKPG